MLKAGGRIKGNRHTVEQIIKMLQDGISSPGERSDGGTLFPFCYLFHGLKLTETDSVRFGWIEIVGEFDQSIS